MTLRFFDPVPQALNSSGIALPGAKLTFYAAGTSTLQDTFSDEDSLIANSNPVIADGAGRFPNIFLLDTAYKVTLSDKDDLQLWERDPYDGQVTSVWLSLGDDPTFVNATTFTLVGDKTTAYHVGRRVRITDGTFLYGTIISSVFTSLTTIIVALDSGSITSGISKVEVSFVPADVMSVPTDGVAYLNPGTGAVPRTVSDRLADVTNVMDFLTAAERAEAVGGSPSSDISVSVQKAVDASSGSLYFPPGEYLCNVISANKIILVGAGSIDSIITPFSSSVAAVTFDWAVGDFTYSAEVRNLGFVGSAKTGVGVTFGKTDPADYVAGDELANNVKFYGCHFFNLDKGVQFPFGNIGTEFYSCGFSNNKYGVYCLNNKFGAAMHPGNKYFYGGEFHRNTCAVYVDAEGFGGGGGFDFYSTIFELNNIAGYYEMTNPRQPISYHNVWFEGNGVADAVGTVAIDEWTGTVQTTQNPTQRTFIFEGSAMMVNFHGGHPSDIHLMATDSQVNIVNAKNERTFPSTVDDISSSIRIKDCVTDLGFDDGDHIIAEGPHILNRVEIGSNGTSSGARPAIIPPLKTIAYADAASKLVAISFEEQTDTGNGSFNLTGTRVADGVGPFRSCMEYTRASFIDTELTKVNSPNSDFTTSTTMKFYTWHISMKVTSGTPPSMELHNRSTELFATGMRVPKNGQWYTFGGIGRTPASSAGFAMFLDFKGGGGTATWRVSGFQIHEFDTLAEAQNFLDSGVFYKPNVEIYNPTITCLTSGSYGMATNSDSLAVTKRGADVFVQGTLHVTSESAPSGGLQISLLYPIASSLADNAGATYIPFIIQNHGDPGIEQPMLLLAAGASIVKLFEILDNGGQNVIDEARVDADFFIYLSFQYLTDE